MADDIADLRAVADYQFGSGAGTALLPEAAELTLTRASSGRPRQIHADGERIGTYEMDGRIRLGVAGGRRLQAGLERPAYRVVVGDESEPFVREGRNAFAKFVRSADGAVRPRDEVVVEHRDGYLLAVGRAELSGRGMAEFETGMAVKVRDAVTDEE
jgi:uncharacterized protein with predicted RNA binding PUA domain